MVCRAAYQDDDVRAITRVDGDVCMWENFRLLPEITSQNEE
jgi:hypothetical protein